MVGVVMMGILVIIKIVFSLFCVVLEVYVGLFIVGVFYGGGKVGDIIEVIGEGLEIGGDVVSMLVEILAIIVN